MHLSMRCSHTDVSAVEANGEFMFEDVSLEPRAAERVEVDRSSVTNFA